METNEKQSPQTIEEQKENFRDFIEFMDDDIEHMCKKMEFWKHLAISTMLGCLISNILGLWMVITFVFFIVSVLSYLTFKHTGRQRNICIIIRESTYEEMLEL